MKNSKVANVIKHNIKKNMQSKWFIGLNILIFISCIAAINFSEITNLISKNVDDVVIEVLKTEELMYDKLTDKFSSMDKLKIKKVDKLTYDEDNFESDRVLIEVNYDTDKILEVKIIVSEPIDGDIYYPIVDATKEIRNDLYAKENNISEKAMKEILKDASIETIIIEQSDNGDNIADKYPVFFVVWSIMFWTVLLVVSSFSKEIFSEKTSKSSEYVLTTITAKEYMIVKIGTEFLNILIQGIIILIYYFLGCLFKFFLSGTSIISIMNINAETVKMLINAFVLCVPYIIVMLIIQMIMSSKASDSTSADSTEWLYTLISSVSIMLPFFLLSFEVLTLDFIKYFLAFIPLFSTFTIFELNVFYGTGIIYTIIALVIYAITIVVLLKIAPNKIKNGILDYKPSKKNKNDEEIRDKKRKEKIKFDLQRKAYIEKISKYSMIIGFGIILYLVLAMMVLPLIVDPVMYGIFEEKVSQENISLIASIITGILSLYIPTKILDIYNKKEMNPNKESKFKWFLIAIPFVVLIFAIQTFIMKKISGTTTVETIENASYLLVFIRLVIVPAIFEELLFRKAIFNASKKQGLVFATIVSAILFGAIHLNFYQAIGATFAGIVFVVVAYKTGSLLPAIILHAMVNGYSFFTSILWINNPLAIKLLNILVVGLTAIGTIILLENILKNGRKVKTSRGQKDKETFDNPLVKTVLLFSNFYFIFAVILLVVCFTVQQEYMNMLM